MKKFLLPAALIVSLALGVAGPAQADSTIGSTVKVKYKPADPADPYGTSKFKGAVGPDKCKKGRKVTIKGLGSERTDSKGKFDFTLSGLADPGRYRVKVAEKSIGDGVTCSKVKVTLTVKRAG